MITSFKNLEAKRQELKKQRPGMKLTHPVFKSNWLPFAGATLSGVLMALCFPERGYSTLAFAALVPLMFAAQRGSLKRSALLGLLSGFVFFMLSLGWLTNLTRAVEGVGLQASALTGYAFLALYCALYFIPFSLTVTLGTRHWVGANIMKNVRFMIAVTMVWVGAEYFRGVFLTGFPWNPLGVTQYANPSIIQIAQWGGVAVISAYIVWMNAGIFITFRQYTHGSRAKKYRPHFELMIGILPVALSVAHGMNTLFNKPELYEHVDLVMIQPNIEQQVKWDARLDQEIRDTLEMETRRATSFYDVDLVIWPETALPDFVRASRISMDLVRRVIESSGKPLLTGSMDVTRVDGRKMYHNSSMLFGADGRLITKYDKQHLVPFGEYVPFPSLMRKFTPIEADFGSGEEAVVFPLPGKPSFSALICFEDTIAPLAANATRAGARWLVNQTNDAWFDPSAQSEQHLAHAVFRCVENRVPMARCCNTGVTAIIDAYGGINRDLDPLLSGHMAGSVFPRPIGMPATFYTRHGDVFAKGALAAGVLSFLALLIMDRKKSAE